MKTISYTNIDLIEKAKAMFVGSDFTVVYKTAETTNKFGDTVTNTFRAVEFTNATGERKFIAAKFIS